MPATNDELLAELQSIRGTIRLSNDILAGKASRKSLVAVAFSVALSLGVAIGGIVYAADVTHDSCLAQNEGRADIRRMTSDVMTEGAEAIVAVATEAEPAQIEAYRAEARRRADEITSRLPDREC